MEQISELELERRLAARFARYFDVYRQVWDVTMKSRIDLVIQHKDSPWLVAGIEVKNTTRKKGAELADFCLQAQRYSHCTWRGFEHFGKIPIFIYPELSSTYLDYFDPAEKPRKPKHVRNHQHHNVNSFLGRAFGIGEVQTVTGYTGEKMLGLRFANKSVWREFYYGADLADIPYWQQLTPTNEPHKVNYDLIKKNHEQR